MDVTLFMIIFGATALLGALSTVLQKHPINAGMSLILTFLSVSGLYGLLDAHFLAFIQIIVYVGAIMILIVYTIMLMDLRDSDMIGRISMGKGIGAIVAAVTLSVLLLIAPDAASQSAVGTPEFGTTAAFARQLFTTWLIPFEVTSVLLLAGIVGALHLARPAVGGEM